MPSNEKCLFCRIATGEIPAKKVHEDDDVVAFHDINPQAPTHVLVIPRRHEPDAASLGKAAPTELVDLVEAAAAVAEQDGLGDGYRLVFNTGPAAHQTVFHAHLHVLGGRAMGWPPG
jgi:histidine triad (HIT) family protein